MRILDNILRKPPQKQVHAVPETILGIAVLSKFRIADPFSQVQQIVEELCSEGYSIDENLTTHIVPVGASVDDMQYIAARIARLFPDLQGEEYVDCSTLKSFQAADGNFGKYYIVLKSDAR